MGMIFTATGKVVDFENITADNISIDDIAHSLSYSSRYNGMLKYLYTIAQHSLNVSERCEPEFALEGLLHDASEAYVGDMVSPLKNDSRLKPFRDVEAQFIDAIADKFDLCHDFRMGTHTALNVIDREIVQDEVYSMGTESYKAIWQKHRGDLVPPAKLIIPIEPKLIETLFLHAFSRLRRLRVRSKFRRITQAAE